MGFRAGAHVVAVLSSVLVPVLVGGCTAGAGDNPFLQDGSGGDKADTAYQNPDGIEVEVDIEADVQAPPDRAHEAPVFLAQFATTYLRERGQFYLESLAEDATSPKRVEWLVDGTWIDAASAAALDPGQLTHFRIKGVNAVLLLDDAHDVSEGQVFEAIVPTNPFDVMEKAGDSCANRDDHLGLDQSIYWYLWNPDRYGCELDTERMEIRVSKMFAPNQATYPEYDRLVADGKVTAVVLFGQIGDGPIDDSEIGVIDLRRMANNLMDAGFVEASSAPVGRRFDKAFGAADVEIDLYSPSDFGGLGDFANFSNLQRAISEHEIIVYDGHSMLGASDFWARPEYPDDYQIFIYGGCLGYEYYVRPILEGKGGWANLDLVSSVVEVSADANVIAGPFFARLFEALDDGYQVSWRDLLVAIRNSVGDSTFGASGIRDNCFRPDGTTACTPDSSGVSSPGPEPSPE